MRWSGRVSSAGPSSERYLKSFSGTISRFAIFRRCDCGGRASHLWTARSRTELKGSIGEGPNHSNFSDRSTVRILGIQRKPRKAPARKKPLRRSSLRPKIQEGAARMERKGKQTALRERGVRRSRTGAKDAILARILSKFRNFR